jgi:hypothetical protein
VKPSTNLYRRCSYGLKSKDVIYRSKTMAAFVLLVDTAAMSTLFEQRRASSSSSPSLLPADFSAVASRWTIGEDGT